MKVFDAEVTPSGKTRVLFATSYDEIEILYGLVLKALENLPRIPQNNEQESRLKNMQKSFAVYLGKSKPKTPRIGLDKCPKCERKLRGEKAVRNHLLDVHSGD